jgi:hypothetical protein
MLYDYVNKVEKILNETCNDIFRVVNHGHYIWFYASSECLKGVVHGGENGTFFELLIFNIGGRETIKYKYYHWKDFENFLYNDFRNDILVKSI